ncbi:MAG: radical SAM protein, partial [Planctomycetota bacterium]
MSLLVDRFGRDHTYLRISLTERCNFQCLYCLPPEGLPDTPPPASHCSDQEILRLVEMFVSLGIRKVRLSGGEPLLRKDAAKLVAEIRQRFSIPVYITTNGSLLKQYLPQLKEAGISGINLSLDTLNRDKFHYVT